MSQPKGEAQVAERAIEQFLGPEGHLDLEAIERFSQLLADRKADAMVRFRSPEFVARLRELVAAFSEKQTFGAGDVVRWKQGLKNKKHPAYNVPAVVVETLDPPRENPAESAGSQYFHEALDLIIAYFMEGDEDELGMYHVDSRRFEHHPDFPSQ